MKENNKKNFRAIDLFSKLDVETINFPIINRFYFFILINKHY